MRSLFAQMKLFSYFFKKKIEMPVNRNALIRYKTIDKCLSNPYRLWSLEDLIDACSDALYEYEGIDKGVSRRTVQMDIQMMRSDKLGYNAPIEVYDKKYYKYTEPNYSITNMPLSKHDLEKLSEATDILRQFKGFAHFQELTGVVQKIEDRVNSEKLNTRPIIDIDKNDGLKGLEHLDFIYRAILDKKVLNVNYQSFNARNPSELQFHPYLLKEYNNRWFLIGHKDSSESILNLALDRICSLSVNNQLSYVEKLDFSANEYYKDVVGVTVKNAQPRNIGIWVDKSNAPYVLTKPLHHSQELLNNLDDGIEIKIRVVPNYELERLILGFGEGMRVLSPGSFARRLQSKLSRALNNYSKQEINNIKS
ncbi:MAG: helix-turn-helix transcriptional regulator [Salinivirgaceae bacterium]